jgi:hypothetical protein
MVGAEPDPQRLGQPDDLAVAGQRGKRCRVQIGCDDLLAALVGVRATMVGARRGGQHLSQLFADPAGQTARRMPEFLDLRGQRAAAAGIEAGNHRTRDSRCRHKTEAAPVDGRIAFGIIPVEEVAVLDEQ